MDFKAAALRGCQAPPVGINLSIRLASICHPFPPRVAATQRGCLQRRRHRPDAPRTLSGPRRNPWASSSRVCSAERLGGRCAPAVRLADRSGARATAPGPSGTTLSSWFRRSTDSPCQMVHTAATPPGWPHGTAPFPLAFAYCSPLRLTGTPRAASTAAITTRGRPAAWSPKLSVCFCFLSPPGFLLAFSLPVDVSESSSAFVCAVVFVPSAVGRGSSPAPSFGAPPSVPFSPVPERFLSFFSFRFPAAGFSARAPDKARPRALEAGRPRTSVPARYPLRWAGARCL
jgi:hypothetical protein